MNSLWEPGYENLLQIYENGIPDDAKVLANQPEGKVYEHNGYVIKERVTNAYEGDVCNECVRREVEVGLIANKYNTQYLVKTIGYFERMVKGKTVSYVITEYIKGIGLYEALSKGTGIRSIYKLLIYIILYLQEIMNFTHYDLHSGNVILVDLGKISRHSFSFNGENKYVDSRYTIKIIDLGRTYVKGIKSSWVETNVIDSATTPGVYDPLFDLARVASDINYIYEEYVGQRLNNLLERNLFSSTEDKVLKLKGYPKDYERVINLRILGGKGWASTKPGDLTFRQAERMYSNTLFGLYYNYGKDPVKYVESLGFGVPYKVPYLPFIKEIPKEDFISPSGKYLYNNLSMESAALDISKALESWEEYIKVKDFYLKVLGKAAVNNKLKRIKSYVDSSYSFADEMINVLDGIRR